MPLSCNWWNCVSAIQEEVKQLNKLVKVFPKWLYTHRPTLMNYFWTQILWSVFFNTILWDGQSIMNLHVPRPCRTCQECPDCSLPRPFFFKFIYFERKRVHGRGRESEGEKESQAGSVLLAQSPMQGLNSQLWDHNLSGNQESNA